MPRIVLFWKPYGVVCRFSPEDGKPTLADFGMPSGVYPAGRLDRDSEGLLLLTDDGGLQHRLTDPKFEHEKTYWAQVEGEIPPAAVARLAAGLLLKDGRTRPCRARLLPGAPELPPRDPPVRFRKTVPTAWLELRLTEGKNRQVRRMTAHVGHPTLRLLRVAIGNLGLEGLQPGAWRELSSAESRRLTPRRPKM